jgi:hypothetical protein
MTYDYRFDPDAPWPVVRGVISGPKGALSIRLVLDSGAHQTQLNRGTMNALGFREQDKTRDAFSVGVGGARERGFEVIVPRFFVLGRKFAETPVSVFEMPYLEGDRVDGLLGWDLIRQFHFELNGPAGVLKVY